MVARYVPERGHVVWLQFTPQAGHEQAGRRPALVVSPGMYNGKVGLALFCPVTSKQKGYPFEVALPVDLPISGVILADQVKSLDWQARQATYICTAPDDVIQEVLEKINLLVS
ncbi:MAG: endoribonuclease MazF [Brevibacillus sp.]|nr:endoribonuclease MazF [Brevibacillus sp.]